MFRSRHIYILASALVNLMLGLYVERCPAGWRRIVQAIGSGLLIGSTAVRVLAFAVEPEKGFQPEMWRSAEGLYAMFLGCMAHFASSIGKTHPSMEQNAAGES